MKSKAWATGFLAAAGLLASAAAIAQPVEHFFKPPAFANVRISPDGKALAALSPVNNRRNLAVVELETRKPRAITAFTTRDVTELYWVNSKRLLLRTGSLAVQDFESRGGGLYAIDRDGGEGRLISEGGDERLSGGVRLVVRPLFLVRTLPGETDDIIAQELIIDAERQRPGELFRVNTRTGQRTSLSQGKPDSGEGEIWVVDDNGVPRALTVAGGGTGRIWLRAGPEAKWEKHDERSIMKQGWQPIGLDEDGKSFLVADNRTSDKAAIVRYDPVARTFGEVLARHPQVDLGDLVRERGGRAVGVLYLADRPGVAWFDEQLARIQRSVDAAFPNRVNLLNWSADRSLVVIDSRTDVDPGSFFLLHTKASKVERLLDRAPWIKPEEMAPMQPVRYKARDGLEIPAYLTLPKKGSAKNLPMVLVVHGGPWVNGHVWGYDPEAQFLASRGYAVLQPNFRGTLRYGWKHFSSSFNQWGLAMQDDLADGVKWAVDEGIADPKRVCIYGGSYGGYATMMGLARHPELYRCGINYVGVTDMELFLTATWSDYAYSDAVQYSLKEMVGDWAKQSDALRNVSPVHVASRIKAPVMLAYGEVDFRVPIEHGLRMRSALERNGVRPVWIVAEGEGHGFRDPKNQALFYGTMEKFLREHLGGGS